MTATNHTEHYELSQYVGDDRPTYTGDYNSDMSKIDAAIYAASQAGGMLTVEHTADLTGDGTTDSPLGVADTIARAEDIPSLNGYATTESVTQAIAAAIADRLTAVEHTADLTGDGSADNPLGVADTIARTEDIPSLDGYATAESVTQAIASAIADRLTAGDIKAGNGISVSASGNQVTISYVGGGSTGGLSAVAHDATLTGDGTSNTPLGVVNGLNFSNFDTELHWENTSLSQVSTAGLYRITGNPQNSADGDIPDFIKEYINVTALLFVYKSGTSALRIIYVQFASTQLAGGTTVRCFGKTYTANGNSAWVDLTPSGSTVSALTSRVAALESQVAALTAAATPAATGLTAEQLDSLYSDGYNIVRVGTPTPSN